MTGGIFSDTSDVEITKLKSRRKHVIDGRFQAVGLFTMVVNQ